MTAQLKDRSQSAEGKSDGHDGRKEPEPGVLQALVDLWRHARLTPPPQPQPSPERMQALDAAAAAGWPARYPALELQSEKWLHFGLGNAAQGLLFELNDRALERACQRSRETGDPSFWNDAKQWGIYGVMLEGYPNPTLQNQGFLYTAERCSNAGGAARTIACVPDGCYTAAEEPGRQLDQRLMFAELISLSVTPNAYEIVPEEQVAARRKTTNGPLLNDDLSMAAGGRPRTALGIIIRELYLRYKHDQPPFTVLALENFPFKKNGDEARAAFKKFAKEAKWLTNDPAFATWLDTVPFPNSMVDRILPNMTNSERARVGKASGWQDQAAMCMEPYVRLVVEKAWLKDRGSRPPLFSDRALQAARQVILCEDVKPHSDLKYAMVNAVHSIIAVLGYTHCGQTLTSVYDVTSKRAYHAWLAEILLGEIGPAFADHCRLTGDNPHHYGRRVLRRMTNRHLRDELSRICRIKPGQDVSTVLAGKIGERVVPVLEAAFAKGTPRARLMEVLARHCLSALHAVTPNSQGNGLNMQQVIGSWVNAVIPKGSMLRSAPCRALFAAELAAACMRICH